MANGTETLSGGNIEPRGLEEEMKSSYLDYAMSVIVGRALPDARDGLKPVHRRILYTQQGLSNFWNRPYIKCARVVRDYGERLVPRLYAHLNPMLYRKAVAMEVLLADSLRKRGFVVFGGH